MTDRESPDDIAARAFAESLVRAAREEGPSRAAYQRTLKALGQGAILGGASALTSTAAALPKASGLSVSFALAAKWGALGVVLGAAALGASHHSRGLSKRALSTPPALSVVRLGAAAPRGSTTATLQAAEPPLAISAASPPSLTPQPSLERKPVPRSSAAQVSIPIEDALAAEAELLGQASAELRARKPALALATLDRHRTAWKSGKLGLEASVLTIEALVSSGQRERAHALGAAVLKAQPQTLFARRIHALLDLDERTSGPVR